MELFGNITLELDADILTEMIKQKVKEQYDRDCTVTFEVAERSYGYGPGESYKHVFDCAKVVLVKN